MVATRATAAAAEFYIPARTHLGLPIRLYIVHAADYCKSHNGVRASAVAAPRPFPCFRDPGASRLFPWRKPLRYPLLPTTPD